MHGAGDSGAVRAVIDRHPVLDEGHDDRDPGRGNAATAHDHAEPLARQALEGLALIHEESDSALWPRRVDVE
eukprot:15331396-Alexandrium_andersonii.AAC.1